MRPLPLLCLLTAACGETGTRADWSLGGVYDAAALSRSDKTSDSGYLWVASPGMTQSCGPAKAPDGLGIFEAEALANAQTPMLAILLQRVSPGDAPLTRDQLQLGLGTDKLAYSLEPAVMPRHLAVQIDGDAFVRYKQQVLTQLSMELCLEHKTGRAWIGGDAHQLRQAFLLDPPDAGGIDRRYFGGERDPIPALLGPPDACVQPVAGLTANDAPGAKGSGSLDLVPSDVWGAALRPCAIGGVAGAKVEGLPSIPMTIGQTASPPAPLAPNQWQGVVATIHGGPDEHSVSFDLTWNGEQISKDFPLFAWSAENGPPGTNDLLARIPYAYPMVGTKDDPHQYTLLLVPNWQIVEGLRRLGAGDLRVARASAGAGVQDGVGYVLEHPEVLFVQIPARSGDEVTWLNVAEPLADGPGGLMGWGYSPGMLAGRTPIALVGAAQPTWAQVRTAHRAAYFGLVLFCGFAAGGVALAGMRRLRDLWSSVPEERVVFWPGGGELEEDEAAEGGEVPEGPPAEDEG